MTSAFTKLIVLTTFMLQFCILSNAGNHEKAPTYMAAPGNALNFDGNNDYIDVGNNPSLQLTQGTIEAWIKTPNAGDSWRGVVVKSMAYGIFLYNNELVAYEWDGRGNINSGVMLNDNKWHHVAFSFNAGVTDGTSLYVDGVKRSSVTFSIYNQNVGLGIGNGSVIDQSQSFNGSIDEVRVWNKALTETEIKSTMYNELTSNEDGLLVYYNFNQGNAGSDNTDISSIKDLSGNGNDGILYNFDLNNTSSNFVESFAMVAPTSQAATNIGSTTFTANWLAPVTGTFDCYKLDVSSNPNFSPNINGFDGLDCGTNLSQEVTGLDNGTTYYYRVRADKSSVSGTGGYAGVPLSIKTLTLPKVLTSAPTKLTSTSASCGGTITIDNDSGIISRGVCWSTNPKPTITDNKTTNGTGTGTFISTLEGLTENTVYYIRAYATTALGTSYGDEQAYASDIKIITDVVAYTCNGSALLSGWVDSPETNPVENTGICWGTTPNPTDSPTDTYNTSGEFNLWVNGLTRGHPYYVRAYAYRNGVTFYGDQQCFNYGGTILNVISTIDTTFNGDYYEACNSNGEYYYKKDNDMAISLISTSCWSIGYENGEGYIENPIDQTVESLPLYCWSYSTLTEVEPYLSCDNNSTFIESADNTGKIENSLTFNYCNCSHNHVSFSGVDNEDFVETGKVYLRFLPAGLTAKVVRKDSATVVFSLTGNALEHSVANNVFSAELFFRNNAFNNSLNTITGNNRSYFNIEFNDNINVTTRIPQSSDIHPVARITNSQLTIQNLSNNSQIEVYNISGKMMLKKQINNSNSFTTMLDSPGVYLINIVSESGKWNFKCINN